MFRSVFNAYRNAYAGLPPQVWMLAVALFVNRFGTMVLPFLTLYMTDDLGFDEASASQMLSVYGLGSIAGSYAGGRFAKRFGAIRTQFFMLVGSVPFFVLVPLVGNWWAIAWAVACLAFFSDAVRPASAVALSEYAPAENRLRAFGLQRMAVNLGISFGPAIGGLLSTVNFVWLFVVDGATTLICAMFLLFMFGLKSSVNRPAGVQHSAVGGPGTKAQSPLLSARFCMFLLLNLLTAMVFTLVHTLYPLYLRQHYELSNPWIGFLFAVNTVLIVAAEMLLLNFVARYSLLKMIAIGAGLSCLGFGMLPFGSSLGFCLASTLIMTLGEMLWMPLAAGWIANDNRHLDHALCMGWYTMTYSIAAVISPLAFGVIYLHDRELTWHLCTALGVVVTAGFLGLSNWRIKELESYATEELSS